MARRNVVDGLLGVLRATNGFEPSNTGTAVAYDERAVAAGVDRAAVILADSFHQEWVAAGGGVANAGRTQITYDLQVALFIRHNNDVVQARQDADTYSGNIIQAVNDNSTLGGSALIAVVSAGRVEDEKITIGGVPFLLESLTVTAAEFLTGS